MAPRSRARDVRDLHTQRHSLENEIEDLEERLVTANERQEPYRSEFFRCHEQLQELHGTRNGGELVSKPTMLAAYDRRMEAGHAWHPHREAAQTIERQLKGVRERLRAVNQEIGA